MLHAIVSTAVMMAIGLVSSPRLMHLDPLELLAGRQVDGKPSLIFEHEGIEYRFASEENKAQFIKNPEKFAVADGGACGSMGPLSGLGDARRLAVHDGKIYFFASDGCRATFLKDPLKCIEADDPVPTGTAAEIAQGRTILDRAVEWCGGAMRFEAMNTFRTSISTKEISGGKEWTVTKETAIRFPDRFFQKEAWNESWSSTISGPDGGGMGTSRGMNGIGPSRKRTFDRTMSRSAVVILKAYVDGMHSAGASSFTVVSDGSGFIDGQSVEFVKVGLHGATSRLAVAKAGGRLVAASFRGRDSTFYVGDSMRLFTKYATVQGVTLPIAYTVTMDGKELSNAGDALEGFEMNVKLPEKMFDIHD